MRITLPRSLKSDIDGYRNLIKLSKLIRETADLEIIINFGNTETFEANLSAILGAIIDSISEQNRIVRFEQINRKIRNILHLNRFLNDESIDTDKNDEYAIVTYMKFTPYKDIEFMDYVKNQMLSKPRFPKHSKPLGKKINESIFELFENARTHGSCKYIYTCGQIITEEEQTRLDFTIVDLGRTIKSNVNEYLRGNLSGSEAIDWAMKSGHTTKTGNVSGGLGLDIIFEFIKLNKGRIQIVSSDGYLEYINGEIVKRTFENFFPGTIANIEFNLDDKASYLLRDEISLDDIF